MSELDTGYGYGGAESPWLAGLGDHIIKLVRERLPNGGEVFEIGCGNGSLAGQLNQLGYSVTALDPSESGIRIARKAHPGVKFLQGSVYDELVEYEGRFPVVISLEVVEHCFWPRKFAATAHRLLQPGGVAIISTPFHGYWKNLALALTNRFDQHWNPLWDGGHIKFWSVRTLSALLAEAGFDELAFSFSGRAWPFSKSMIVTARHSASRVCRAC